jgi:glycosyltransferase involved in cell wall biosynthesis
VFGVIVRENRTGYANRDKAQDLSLRACSLVWFSRCGGGGSLMNNSLISIVIPAYNEQNTIGETISGTIRAMDSLRMPYEVIVVNDGSTDNTEQIASGYKTTLLSNSKNQGKGYTLRRGFQHAQGDIVVTIDSDGAHEPKEIPDLVRPLFNGVDVVNGSRYLGGRMHTTTRLNRMGNATFNLAIMILTGKRVTDSQSGFRAFKREVLQKINLQSLGYDIEVEMTVKSLKNCFVFFEKPIYCEKRKHSYSKLRILRDGIRIFKAIIKANFSPVTHDS